MWATIKSVLSDNQFFSRYGKDPAEIGKQFFILDAEGLITKARHNLSELEVTLMNCRKLDFRNHISTTFFQENFYDLSSFAEDDTSMEGLNLLEVKYKCS